MFFVNWGKKERPRLHQRALTEEPSILDATRIQKDEKYELQFFSVSNYRIFDVSFFQICTFYSQLSISTLIKKFQLVVMPKNEIGYGETSSAIRGVSGIQHEKANIKFFAQLLFTKRMLLIDSSMETSG